MRDINRRGKLCAIAVSIAVVGLSLVGATPAHAATTTAPAVPADTVINYSCGPNINPDNSVASTRTDIMTRSLPGGGTVALRKGFDRGLGQWIYWTRVTGNHATNLHLDWSDTGGRTYHICKVLAYNVGTTSYTLAVNNWGGRVYKAFAQVGNTFYGSATWQQ